MKSISQPKDLEKKLEFIQYSLRKYALAYGASIIYTSSK